MLILRYWKHLKTIIHGYIKDYNLYLNYYKILDKKYLRDDKKDWTFFQYNSGDLVYIFTLLTSQLRTSSRKVAIKYIGLLVVYKITDPPNYLLMT